MDVFKAVRLTENVYWVGAIDWAVRDFHGYSTGRGTTYNAYLILSEKITLIDTVKKPFFEEMMLRISSVIDPSRIEIIVSNHSEMDHTGALPQTIAAVKPDKIYASPMGSRALTAHFHWEDDPIEVVKTGDSIDLGNMRIEVIETRMLHWPDSMISYLPEEKILFSQDGFGMHLASAERFDDELEFSVLEAEARKYYANILMPFSPLVTALLGNLGKMELEQDITSRVVEMIVRDGRLAVAVENQDSVIEGTVTQYAKTPYSYTSGEVVEEYKLEIRVEISFTDLLQETDIIGTESVTTWLVYDPDTESEIEARDRLLEESAQDIVRRCLSGW